MVKGARLHEIYICTFRKVSDATEIKTLLPLRNIQYRRTVMFTVNKYSSTLISHTGRDEAGAYAHGAVHQRGLAGWGCW